MDTVRFSQIVESSGKPDTHLLLIDPAKDKTLQAAIKSNRVMTVYQGSRDTKTDYGTIGFAEGPSRQFLIFPKTLKPFADKRVIGIKYELLESIPVSQDETTSEPKSDKASKPTRDQAPTEVDRQPAIPKRGLSDQASSNLRTAANSGRSRNKRDKPADDQPDRRPKSLAEVTVVKPAGTAQSKKKPSARLYAREKKTAPGAPPEKVVEFPKPEPNAQPVVRSDEVERLKRRVREAIDVLEQGKQVAAYNLLKSIVEE
ncbi:MAG TPA: hypothetical protein VHS80_14365 [Chthoniobacterales bacterium]|nr:hypothetical protein [Chthoniobacterales bacterium]